MKKVYAFAFAIALISLTLALLPDNSIMPVRHLDTFRSVGSNKRYVLINFWVSYDAKSREENIRFSEVLRRYAHKNSDLGSISISLDDYEGLFREVLRTDDLCFSKVIRDKDGMNSKFAREFEVGKNNMFGNVLLDSDGRVLKKNITPEELEIRLKKM